MSRRCAITGKGGLAGNNVSHANNKTRHVQQPNLQKKKLFVPELNRTVTVKISAHGLRIVDRKGAYKVLKELGLI